MLRLKKNVKEFIKATWAELPEPYDPEGEDDETK